MVADGNADVSVSQAGLTPGRAAMGLEYIMLAFRNLHYAMRHPVKVDSFYTVTYPFTTELWIAIFITVIVMAILLSVMNWYVFHNTEIEIILCCLMHISGLNTQNV